MISTKRCPRCRTKKPVSEFAIDRSRADGLVGRCKACDNLRARVYYATTGKAKRAKRSP